MSKDSERENHRSWVHRLYLDAYFEDALAKMRADTGQGDTYALLTALNEYLYERGYMNEKAYLMHKQKYGVGLIEELEKKLSKTEKQEKPSEKELQLEQTLKNILKQWDTAPESSKKYYFEEAQQYSHLPIAQQILKKYEAELSDIKRSQVQIPTPTS